MTTKFERGSGCYDCRSCKKKTRSTGHGEADVRLCRLCYEISGRGNGLSDNCHDECFQMEDGSWTENPWTYMGQAQSLAEVDALYRRYA